MAEQSNLPDRPPLLIVGASGFVGGILHRHFVEQEYPVLGTCSRSPRAGLYPFDLRDERIFQKLPLDSFTSDHRGVALICAACASVEACGRDPKGSRAVNVTGTMQLLNDLRDRGFRVVFFSTSAVHDGRLPLYDESISANPINEYGRQKAEVENYLLSQVRDALIVRLSKAIDIEPAIRNVFSEWHEQARGGVPIPCIADESFSPTWTADICTAIQRLIELGQVGLFHVANPECFTRASLASLFLTKIGLEVPVVLRQAADFGFVEPRVKYSCLDSRKLTAATGVRFVSTSRLIDMFCDRAVATRQGALS